MRCAAAGRLDDPAILLEQFSTEDSPEVKTVLFNRALQFAPEELPGLAAIVDQNARWSTVRSIRLPALGKSKNEVLLQEVVLEEHDG